MSERDRLLAIIQANNLLREARSLLRRAGARKAYIKTWSAIRSTDGAIRNRSRFASQSSPAGHDAYYNATVPTEFYAGKFAAAGDIQ